MHFLIEDLTSIPNIIIKNVSNHNHFNYRAAYLLKIVSSVVHNERNLITFRFNTKLKDLTSKDGGKVLGLRNNIILIS